jgi:hypothetical protein
MAASTPTTDVVRTITVPLVKGTETAQTVRFIEAGKADAKNSAALLWLDKAVLELLGAQDASDLTVTITAVKGEPGIVVFPPAEAPEADEPKADAPPEADTPADEAPKTDEPAPTDTPAEQPAEQPRAKAQPRRRAAKKEHA